MLITTIFALFNILFSKYVNILFIISYSKCSVKNKKYLFTYLSHYIYLFIIKNTLLNIFHIISIFIYFLASIIIFIP